ncbi:MAG: hypothetical protein Q8L99_01585 [Polycyclovorans sp.]|nr:hypothetical protein [Polycyclovorans sp.]
MQEALNKLANYTLALREALGNTNQASERPLITGRLAAAAEMFALLHKHDSVEIIQELVLSEIRAHGWSFIAGENGVVVANKWVAFTNEIGIKQ